MLGSTTWLSDVYVWRETPDLDLIQSLAYMV
jgi:hypothetical protein